MRSGRFPVGLRIAQSALTLSFFFFCRLTYGLLKEIKNQILIKTVHNLQDRVFLVGRLRKLIQTPIFLALVFALNFQANRNSQTTLKFARIHQA